MRAKKFRVKVKIYYLTHPARPAGISERWVVSHSRCAQTLGCGSRHGEEVLGFILTLFILSKYRASGQCHEFKGCW